MLDLADTTVADEELAHLTQGMYEQAGIGSKDKMDFEDFKKVFASKEYEKTLNEATLSLEGNVHVSRSLTGGQSEVLGVYIRFS